MEGIYLLLGTNMGNKVKNLERVRELLVSNRVAIKRESSIYETAAWGIEDQPSFLNQVLEIDTSKTPDQLLELAVGIEEDMGRIKKEKWGERLIDVDLLYYNSEVVNSEALTIPHPEIQNRRFTLLPLTELVPKGIHPVSQKSQIELLDACEDRLEVKKVGIV